MKIQSLFRKISRPGIYHSVNCAGLSMAATIMLLIVLFVYRELTTNMFHENIKNIHCISLDGRSGTPFLLGEALKAELPGVNSFTRVQLWDLKSNVLRYGNSDPVDLDMIIRADTNFFEFFTFRFIKGDPFTCLDAPGSFVLTESSATRLFGKGDPLGKVISYNKGQILLTVTAVIKDPPVNSSLRFNAVMSVKSLPVIYPPFINAGPFFWSFETFVSLSGIRPDDRMFKVASEIFRSSIPAASVKEARELFNSKFEVRLIPFSKVYFDTSHQTSMRRGDIRPVYWFSVIGVLIMLVAIINFVNLSNAIASMRMKEAIVRKISGALFRDLFSGFLLETVIICFISLCFALLFSGLITKFINSQEMPDIRLEFFSIPGQAVILIAGSIVLGLVAGFYPAYVNASVKVSVTSRTQMIFRASHLRKSLLAFQFFISAGLVICTLVISRQYSLISESPDGFDVSNVITFRLSNELKKNYTGFINRLKQNPFIGHVSNAGYGFIGGKKPYPVELVYKGRSIKMEAMHFTSDTGFIELLGINLIQGHSLQEHDNIPYKMMLNQAALREINCGDDILEISMPDKVHGITWKVVGVVNDFNTRSHQYPVCPYLFYHVPGDPDLDGLYIKLKTQAPEQTDKTIRFIRDAWSEFSPQEPINIEFLEDARNRLYHEVDSRKKLFLFFSIFSVLISCLGLYALSGFILARRTREIGIRKVYGADKRTLTAMLATDFIFLSSAGFIFAVPVTLILMKKWLHNFAMKTGIDWWIFLSAGIIIIIVSFAAVYLEVHKAITRNPADVIRYE